MPFKAKIVKILPFVFLQVHKTFTTHQLHVQSKTRVLETAGLWIDM